MNQTDALSCLFNGLVTQYLLDEYNTSFKQGCYFTCAPKRVETALQLYALADIAQALNEQDLAQTIITAAQELADDAMPPMPL